MPLIVKTLEKNTGTIENHFLNLLSLRPSDAETILRRVKSFLKDNKLDINRVRFAGMDGCLTMSGKHNGVKKLL